MQHIGGPAVETVEDVGAEDDRRPTLRLCHEKCEQLRPREHVKAVGSLVEKDELTAREKLAEELHPPALAIRDGRELGSEKRDEAERLNESLHA